MIHVVSAADIKANDSEAFRIIRYISSAGDTACSGSAYQVYQSARARGTFSAPRARVPPSYQPVLIALPYQGGHGYNQRGEHVRSLRVIFLCALSYQGAHRNAKRCRVIIRSADDVGKPFVDLLNAAGSSHFRWR